MNKTKIFLADDHAILRDGLRRILETVPGFVITGEASDGKTAIEEIERVKPDIAILDISMPVMTGIDATRQIKKYHPEIKIIILSRHDSEDYINSLLQYGINGYVLKESAGDDLVNAVRTAMDGNIYLSPRITGMILRDRISGIKSITEQEDIGPAGKLSNREKEIIKLIAEGKTSKNIARILRISENTVKAHRANIMQKLDVCKTADLVKYAIKEGLVEL